MKISTLIVLAVLATGCIAIKTRVDIPLEGGAVRPLTYVEYTGPTTSLLTVFDLTGAKISEVGGSGYLGSVAGSVAEVAAAPEYGKGYDPDPDNFEVETGPVDVTTDYHEEHTTINEAPKHKKRKHGDH